jgi:hypothetical protein
MPRIATAAFVLVLALTSVPAWSVQELTLGTANVLRGQTAEVPLGFTGDGSSVALQVDVAFNPAVLGAPAVVGGAALGGHAVRSGVVAPGRLRVVIYSPANAPLGNGVLARFSFSVGISAPVGESPVTFASTLLGNTASGAVAVTQAGSGLVRVLPGVPPQIQQLSTVADTGDGVLLNAELASVPITQLLVRFSGPVSDPAGNTAPGDVTNPTSYRLFRTGPDGAPGASCAGGTPAGAAVVTVNGAAYAAGTSTAALSVGSGFALSRGRYRLLVCGSITSPEGAALDGNGDGTPGDDASRTFEVAGTNLLVNPNFDQSLGSWIPVSPTPGEIVRTTADVDGAATSGAARVTNLTGTGQLFSLAQCVGITGSGAYVPSGRVRTVSGRTSAPSISAIVDFRSGAGCSGALLATGTIPVVRGDTAGAWSRLSGTVNAPAGALSALVMFVLDAGTSPDFVVDLDSLSFERAEIFRDGFESGTTSQWIGGN